MSRLDLKGLDDSDVVTFLEVAAGHVLDKTGVELAHAVYRETDGNPFFVTEVLRHLSESGAIVQDAAGHWVPGQGFSQLTLPDSVREVVGARVARLGDRAAKILSTAAIIGRDFDIDLLAEVTGSDEDALLDLLDDAEASDLVCELPGTPGRYGFSHALIQHTLYEDMGATRRARMHRLVAEALEELLGDRPDERVGELARHFLLATRPVHTDKAITYAARAGEHALEALAPEDGVRYFSQALELADSGALADPLLRVRLLLSLGTAQRQAGIPAFRETLLEAARQAEEPGPSTSSSEPRSPTTGVPTAPSGRSTPRSGGPRGRPGSAAGDREPDRALLLATLCLELTHGPLDRRRSLTAEAKAMAETLGDPTTMIDVLNLCNEPRQIPALFDERFADNTQALALAEQLGDPMRLFWSASRAEIDAVQGGRFEVANKCLDLMKRTSQQLHQPTLVWNTTRREAAHALVIGDPDKPAGNWPPRPWRSARRAANPSVHLLRDTAHDRPISARAAGGAGPAPGRRRREAPGIPAYRAGLASAHLEAGDDDAARQLWRRPPGTDHVAPPTRRGSTVSIGYSWVAVELGHEPAAGQLLELLATYKNQTPFSGVVPHTPVACYLGGLASLFGRFEEAETYSEIATNLNTAGNMRFAEAKRRCSGAGCTTRAPRATWTGLGSCSRSPNRSPRRTVTVEFSVSSRRPAPCSELQWPRWDAHRTTLTGSILHWGASPDRPPAWGPGAALRRGEPGHAVGTAPTTSFTWTPRPGSDPACPDARRRRTPRRRIRTTVALAIGGRQIAHDSRRAPRGRAGSRRSRRHRRRTYRR